MRINPDGSESTHITAQLDNLIYPLIYQIGNTGGWTERPDIPENASDILKNWMRELEIKYAEDAGELYEYPIVDAAERGGEGTWKDNTYIESLVQDLLDK